MVQERTESYQISVIKKTLCIGIELTLMASRQENGLKQNVINLNVKCNNIVTKMEQWQICAIFETESFLT